MNATEILAQAALHMIDHPRFQGAAGCCSAIEEASVGSPHTQHVKARHHFRAMFDPHDEKEGFWFGGGKPQWQLEGAKRVRTAEHRAYALLLAAASYEG